MKIVKASFESMRVANETADLDDKITTVMGQCNVIDSVISQGKLVALLKTTKSRVDGVQWIVAEGISPVATGYQALMGNYQYRWQSAMYFKDDAASATAYFKTHYADALKARGDKQ